MKTLGILMASLALSASASASVSSTLTSINVDPTITSFDPARQQMGGSITLDFEKQTASIGVTMSAYCPDPTAPCPKYVRLVLHENLPIVEVKTDTACGETIYVAQEDKRPVDGSLKKLEITDNGTLIPGKCAFFRAPDPVTATYTTETNGFAGVSKTSSTFVGTALK